MTVNLVKNWIKMQPPQNNQSLKQFIQFKSFLKPRKVLWIWCHHLIPTYTSLRESRKQGNSFQVIQVGFPTWRSKLSKKYKNAATGVIDFKNVRSQTNCILAKHCIPKFAFLSYYFCTYRRLSSLRWIKHV